MSIQTDCVRITALFNKKQGLTDEEFKRHWLEHHSKVFSSMEIAQKNLTKYEQCHPNALVNSQISTLLPVAKWDAMVIFEAESYDKILEVLSSKEYQEQAVPDEEKFIDRSSTQLLATDLAPIMPKVANNSAA